LYIQCLSTDTVEGRGLLIRGAREGEELRGLLITNGRGGSLLLRGTEGRREGTEKQGERIPPHKVKVSTINTGYSSNTQMDGHDRFQYLAR